MADIAYKAYPRAVIRDRCWPPVQSGRNVNVLVFVLFAMLGLCFATALVFAPAELDELWCAFRRPGVIMLSRSCSCSGWARR